MTQSAVHTDIVIVGAGAAGLSAAIGAAHHGAKVLVLEAASPAHSGGNTRWSVGVVRSAYDSREQLQKVLDPNALQADVFVPPYDAERFARDLRDVTRGEAEDILVRVVTERSFELLQWWRENGVAFDVAPFRFGRPSGGSSTEPGLPSGAGIITRGGGPRLLDTLTGTATALGADLRYNHRITALASSSGGWRLTASTGASTLEVNGRALIIAAGGLAGSRAARARYLGPGWDLAKFRGSPHTTGVVTELALYAGAQAAGQWSGVHAVATAPEAPSTPDARVGDVYGRYSYPYGITVDLEGLRFFDEGASHKNLTYSTVGAAIHARPQHRAFQLFDQRGLSLLEERYRTSEPVVADTLTELAEAVGIRSENLQRTVRDYNDACHLTPNYDPHDLDGVSARPPGQPPKSNWAAPLDVGPFVAYPVVPSITFMFGGLAIDGSARVLGPEGTALPGVWACGDAVGGLAVHGLPAGTGMVAAGVVGRIAGENAAKEVQA